MPPWSLPSGHTRNEDLRATQEGIFALTNSSAPQVVTGQGSVADLPDMAISVLTAWGPHHRQIKPHRLCLSLTGWNDLFLTMGFQREANEPQASLKDCLHGYIMLITGNLGRWAYLHEATFNPVLNLHEQVPRTEGTGSDITSVLMASDSSPLHPTSSEITSDFFHTTKAPT